MVRKAACLVLLAFIFTASAGSGLGIVSAEPKKWTVGHDPQADFNRIQEALDAASSGDTVFVKAGTYYERLLVSKSVSLLGENKETTVVDGLGAGTVIQITASNVVISNFTVRSAGGTWGPPLGFGTPDSCVAADGVSHVQIVDNILVDAAVCVWTAHSSSVNVSDNTILSGVYGGIIGYASLNVVVSRNLVDRCGLMGIHLDGYSSDCIIAQNTVTNNVEGLELELGSATNRIEDNAFANNNVSIVLNKCGSFNVFRGNTMTHSMYHLVVVGYSVESFLQDIDSSNIVNNKLVYYLINLRDQGVTPLVCPNLGYLALVNCTNVWVKDFNVFGNGDGVLIAFSSGCVFTNITVGGNRGPLLWGGFTFYNSDNNVVAESRISANSYAFTFYHSEGNNFHHNYLVDNERHVVSDFLNPFSATSSGYFSANVWDDGTEGNYWSDYKGIDGNEDGIGDTPYIIDAQNVDHCPLMSSLPVIDTEPPSLVILSPRSGETITSSSVTVSWKGIDYASGISHYEIDIDGGYVMNVGLNTTYPFTGLSSGRHIVRIGAFDKAGNARYELLDFVVNTARLDGISWPPYIAEAVSVIVIVVVVGIALYALKGRFTFRIRKTSRRLVRQCNENSMWLLEHLRL